jgi:glycosyltransferase involved in cell wall biosynthesis
MQTCIVIPCYNEADRLEQETFLRYAESHTGIHFLFVNDGSSDATGTLIQKMAERYPEKIAFINRTKNKGKAESVREGIFKALEWKTFDFVGFLDADLSTPLEEIEWLQQHFQSNPDLILAFGSRKQLEGNIMERNAFRHHFGRLYAGFITGLVSLPVYDTQCGAKIFRADAAAILFRRPFIDRWLFDVEVFCRIKNKYGNEFPSMIREVTLREWREKGNSRIRKRDILQVPLKTLRIFFTYR